MHASKNIYNGMISCSFVAFFVALIAALFMGGVRLLSAGNADGADATVKITGGIPHVSGGIGGDSITKLESPARDFNLKLVFALQSAATSPTCRWSLSMPKENRCWMPHLQGRGSSPNYRPATIRSMRHLKAKPLNVR